MRNLNELFDEVEGLPDDFLIQLNVLRCNGDGSDFRYITDKAGMPYFKGEVLPVLKPLEYFFRLSNTDVELVDKPRGKFDIQTSSLCTMGHVSTDYDESMCLILQGIKENRLSIDDVYLPLLYLVRHSIELSLKQNLLNAGQKYLTSKSILKIKNEHSICKLFNKFETVINIAISNILDSTEFKQDTEKHHRSLGELKDIIHDIESNSYYFRFPMDRYGQSYNLNIDGNKLVKILKLRERIDAYVTFAVPLLQEYGYLDYDD